MQDKWSSAKTDRAVNCEQSFAASSDYGGQIPCMREDGAAALDTGAAGNLAANLAAANRDLVMETRKLPRVSTWMRASSFWWWSPWPGTFRC